MTPRERISILTEDTKISLGVVLLVASIIAGGIVWLTTISIQASDALESTHRVEKKQDSYSDELQEIKLTLQEMSGELKRIRK